ncbi:glycosyltransferase, partial [Thermodesulfobacteriota bacterium]
KEMGDRISAKEVHIRNIEGELSRVYNSKAWKLARIFNKVANVFFPPESIRRNLLLIFLKIVLNIKRLFKALTRRRMKALLKLLMKGNIKGVLHKLEDVLLNRDKQDLYQVWIDTKEREYFSKTDFSKAIDGFTFKPLISIIVPVYKVDVKWLKIAIESVKSQFYANWELCLVDDCSKDSKITQMLKKYANSDKRIKYKLLEENSGISEASNEAANLSTGDYIALLDHDDELTPNALFEVVKLLNEKRDAKFIYSDEDKKDAEGNRCEVYFKPDYNPDLLMSCMYICHLSVYERELFFSCGAFRKGYEGSQDHDLALRASEQTDQIYHIAKVLYHWRKVKGSTAESFDAKESCINASLNALKDACERRGFLADVVEGKFNGSYRVKRKLTDDEKVSVIIPFKDKVKFLKPCVESVLEKAGYENIEIILVNNMSKEKATLEYLNELKGNDHIKILDYDKIFNFSAINNFAVEKATGKYILLLNNDTKAISDDFIVTLKEHAERAEVGAVGAKLLYDNMTNQHAGIVLGVGGIANHSLLGYHNDDNSYFGLANIQRNLSAVTGACLMLKKSVFEEVGGFDETNLKVAFNDVDLCLKIMKAGYLNVYTPYCQLYHFESISRGAALDKDEVDFMMDKYDGLLKNDPYYNPNLSLRTPDYLPDA